MASQVEICNRALIKLGANTITSISDNSKPARTLGALWDSIRRTELSKRYWNFAISRAILPALADSPTWGFANAFQLPNDFLKIVQVSDLFISPGLSDYRTGDESPYAIEGKTLVTDFAAPLKIRYIQDVTDTGSFDVQFIEVMASKLAYESCYAITQSRDGQRQAAEDYSLAVKEAARCNALSRPPAEIPDDSWVLGRL